MNGCPISGTEVSAAVMWDAFQGEYLPSEPRFQLLGHELRSDSSTGRTTIVAQLMVGGAHRTIDGEGNGPIDAFVKALRSGLGATLDVTDYTEHAIGQGSEAMAVAYVETQSKEHGVLWGVGTDPSTITASLRAVLNAYERSQRG